MDNDCVGEGSGKSLPQWRRHLTGMPASPVKHFRIVVINHQGNRKIAEGFGTETQ